MSEHDDIEELLRAAGFIKNDNVTEKRRSHFEEILGYDDIEITKMLENNIEPTDGISSHKIEDLKFYNDARLKQIRLGLAFNKEHPNSQIDVLMYTQIDRSANRPVFSANQMRVIRCALEYNIEHPENKVDVNFIAQTQDGRSVFDSKEMNVLFFAMKRGIDVSKAVPRYGHYTYAMIKELGLEGIYPSTSTASYPRRDFNKRQMEQINLGKEHGIDTSIYEKYDSYNPAFSAEQMEQLRLGMEKGLDVSVFANNNYSAKMMTVFRRCLESNVDITPYVHTKKGRYESQAVPVFNNNQLKEIRYALEYNLDNPQKKIDIDLFAKLDDDGKPVFNEYQMKAIRRGLEKGLDVSKFAKPEYSSYRMAKMSHVLSYGLDITPLENLSIRRYSQLDEIADGLKKGLDVSIYANPKFSAQEMCQIKEGLEHGIDVSWYTKTDSNGNLIFNEFQREVIKESLINGIDVSLITQLNEDGTPVFSSHQMKVISNGISEGLDMSICTKRRNGALMFSGDEMSEIADGLRYNKEHPDNQIDISYYATGQYNAAEMRNIRNILIEYAENRNVSNDEEELGG